MSVLTHSWRTIEEKVAELRNLTFDEVAKAILDLEVQLEECVGKLSDAEDRLEDMRYEMAEVEARNEDMRGD